MGAGGAFEPASPRVLPRARSHILFALWAGSMLNCVVIPGSAVQVLPQEEELK